MGEKITFQSKKKYLLKKRNASCVICVCVHKVNRNKVKSVIICASVRKSNLTVSNKASLTKYDTARLS